MNGPSAWAPTGVGASNIDQTRPSDQRGLVACLMPDSLRCDASGSIRGWSSRWAAVDDCSLVLNAVPVNCYLSLPLIAALAPIPSPLTFLGGRTLRLCVDLRCCGGAMDLRSSALSAVSPGWVGESSIQHLASSGRPFYDAPHAIPKKLGVVECSRELQSAVRNCSKGGCRTPLSSRSCSRSLRLS